MALNMNRVSAELAPIQELARIGRNNTPHASRKIGAPWGVIFWAGDDIARAPEARYQAQVRITASKKP